MSLYYSEEHGKRYVSAAPPGTVICDFCSVPNPVKVYEAMDAEVVPDHMSEGGWAACTACAQLIDANDREGLLQRSVVMFAGRIQVPLDEETIEALRMVQNKFFELRIETTNRKDNMNALQAEPHKHEFVGPDPDMACRICGLTRAEIKQAQPETLETNNKQKDKTT